MGWGLPVWPRGQGRLQGAGDQLRHGGAKEAVSGRGVQTWNSLPLGRNLAPEALGTQVTVTRGLQPNECCFPFRLRWGSHQKLLSRRAT